MGFGAWSLGSGFRVQGLGLGLGLGCVYVGVWGSEFRVWGLGLRVKGVGFGGCGASFTGVGWSSVRFILCGSGSRVKSSRLGV